MGIAFYYSHSGHFAHVAKVKVEQSGKLTVQKVWVVGDVGSQIINPTNAVNQCEGAVIDGVSQLYQKITFDKGRTQQSNFFDMPILRMSDAPQVDVHFHHHGQLAHRPWRTGSAAGASGYRQRDLRSDRQAYPQPATRGGGPALGLTCRVAYVAGRVT